MLCSCSQNAIPEGTRQVNGLLQITPGESTIIAWDETGKPIATLPDNERVANQTEKLASSDNLYRRKDGCIGILYDATFVIGREKAFRTFPMSSARLVTIIRTRVSERSDDQLRQLMHKVDMSAALMCRAGDQPGKLRPLKDDYVTGSRLTKSR